MLGEVVESCGHYSRRSRRCVHKQSLSLACSISTGPHGISVLLHWCYP